MRVTRPMFLVFAAAFSTGAYAAETALPVKALPAKQAANAQAPATPQPAKKAEQQKPVSQPVEPGYTNFDEMNEAVNDPLYIKGTRELLKKSIREDAAKQPVLRDAPNSNEPKLKKPRVKKHLPADPVKGNNLI